MGAIFLLVRAAMLLGVELMRGIHLDPVQDPVFLSTCSETPLPLAHKIIAQVEGTLELENYHLLAIKDQHRHKASPEGAALKSKVSTWSHGVAL